MYLGCIYKITNIVNNKIYIGQTQSNPPRKRFNSHIYDSKHSNMIISRAIRKHGKENFIFEIIHLVSKNEDINSLELYYIQKYNSLKPNGYNCSLVSKKNYKHSEETKNKISKFKNSKKQKEISSNQGKSNRGNKRKNTTSKYSGVRFKDGQWQLSVGKKYLGTYKTELDAAKARDIYEILTYKENAKLNFPELKNEYINGSICIERNKKWEVLRKNKKSDSEFIGVYYSKTRKKWIFDRKGFKTKSFESKKEAEEYSKNPIKSSL